MGYPLPENWTFGWSERVVNRLNKLFELYEQHAEFDNNDQQVDDKAELYYEQGLSLQERLPIEDKKILGYTDLF